MINHPYLNSYPNATVHSVDEFNALDSTVQSIILDGCNDRSLTVLNLARFLDLKEFEVVDYSLYYVNEVKLIGLDQLERVVIGKRSFTKQKSWPVSLNPNRHFYLKNCKRLRELRIGRYSFSDYSVCEIENVPSLEVIEMGQLNDSSGNCWHASLELKSDSERMK